MRDLYVGIDNGTRIIGMAAVDERRNVVWTRLIRVSGKIDSRLKKIWKEATDSLCGLDGRFYVGIEGPFFGRNTRNNRTPILLGYSWGIMYACALSAGASGVYEIAPSTAKLALTGAGNATKEQMCECAGYDSQDVSDAVGVALAVYDKLRGDRKHKNRVPKKGEKASP